MEAQGNPEKLILPEPSHFGYVTRDLERSIDHFQRLFGIASFTRMTPNYSNKTYRGKPEDFAIQLALARVGPMVYELIQVLKGKTVYGDFLEEHGEGIHHLGYEIDHLAKWKEAYRKIRLEPIMSGERRGLKWAYFDTGEIVVELLERTPEGRIV